MLMWQAMSRCTSGMWRDEEWFYSWLCHIQ